MVREHLSEELTQAGLKLLKVTDGIGMAAQGAMWIHSEHFGYWRYYLVTSLVDTLGRRKTYQLLLQAFAKLPLPAGLTIADVHLGSPSDPIFMAVSSALAIDGGIAHVEDCVFNGLHLNAVIYRTVGHPPVASEQAVIEKAFLRKVKELAKAA